MMSNEKEVYETAMAGYQSAIIDEQAAYQRAQLTGDFGEQVRASQSIAALRSQAQEFTRMATEHVASMRPAAAPSAFGLSDAEREVAKFSGVTEEQYAANKTKMLAMKEQGYWSQGQQREKF